MDAGQPRLNLEELDSRILPSHGQFRVYGTEGTPLTSPIALSPPSYHGYRVLANSPLLVEGTATPAYTKTMGTTTTSASYALIGAISLYGFGNLSLSGTINALGPSSDRASGQLTLSSNRGTITLNLIGPDNSVRGAIANDFYFTVTSATGEYAHAGGIGLVHIGISPTSATTGHVTLSLT
jgi:hypothetical protein